MKKKKFSTWPFALCLAAEKGFSLIELLLVLMILGLSGLIVLPSIERGLRQRELRQSVLEFAAAARHLRSQAVYEGVPQSLLLDLTQNSYHTPQRAEIRLSPNIRISTVEGGQSSEVGLRQFLFFPNGSNLGGEISFSSVHESSAYFVRLEPLTGRVVVVRRQ